MPEQMKEILAIIRPEKWRDTQKAMMAAGAQGLTQHRALGRGKQAGLKYAGAEVDGVRTAVVMGYLPKRVVTCFVQAGKVDAVVHKLIEANRTGNPGDGKVFVLPVTDAWRVRTGERGVPAIV